MLKVFHLLIAMFENYQLQRRIIVFSVMVIRRIINWFLNLQAKIFILILTELWYYDATNNNLEKFEMWLYKNRFKIGKPLTFIKRKGFCIDF